MGQSPHQVINVVGSHEGADAAVTATIQRNGRHVSGIVSLLFPIFAAMDGVALAAASRDDGYFRGVIAGDEPDHWNRGI